MSSYSHRCYLNDMIVVSHIPLLCDLYGRRLTFTVENVNDTSVVAHKLLIM